MTKKNKAGTDELLFLPLGGAGEIGMNLNLFGLDGKWLMVDCGVTFGDDSMPGVDVVMADPHFIEKRRKDLSGLVVTHAHEDHVGAVAYLWDRFKCPVWCSPFTFSILKRKLAERGLQDEVPVTVVRPGERFSVGPFGIEMIRLTHSIPEPNALIIRTPLGNLFHTGDWKFDPAPLIGEPADDTALKAVGDEGVLALIGDSTNVFSDGTAGSELAVRESLQKIVSEQSNRVVVSAFASNVARMETLYEVAQSTGREAALVGRSLWRMYEAAQENGYLKDVRFVSEQDAPHLPRDKALIICTGSQGEPRAALMRIATGSHPHVSLEPDDTVIFSSKQIPGNEKAIGRLQDLLVQQGVRLITESSAFVHVSGHPCRDELTHMMSMIRPEIVVPVHGEVRHLYEHAALAEKCQVPRTVVATNGRMVRLAPNGPELIDAVTSGRLALDGERLVQIDSPVLRERKRVLYQGAVVATLVVDRAGDLAAEPQVTLTGLADDDDAGDELYDAILDEIEDVIEGLPRKQRRDNDKLEDTVRVAIRRVVTNIVGKKPSTDVHLVRLDQG